MPACMSRRSLSNRLKCEYGAGSPYWSMWLEGIPLAPEGALERRGLAAHIVDVTGHEDRHHQRYGHRAHPDKGQVDRPCQRGVIGRLKERHGLGVDRLSVRAAGAQLDTHSTVP